MRTAGCGQLQSDAHSADAGFCDPSTGCLSCLEYAQIPDFPDCWRPAQDEVSDVLGHQSPGNIRGNTFYELRRNLHDERVRLALEAVFVTDSVIHVSMARMTRWGRSYVAFDT